MDNNYLKNAYYLLVREGYNNQELDKALLNLVVVVLKNKNYGIIHDYQILVNDFEEIIGFELPYFPMKRICGLALKDGYLFNEKISHKLMVNYSKVRSASCMSEVIERQNNIKKLVTAFQNYIKDSELSYSEDDLQDMLNSFIDNQGMVFYNNKRLDVQDSRRDYLFAKFLTDPNNSKYYDLVDEMIAGRILSELVTQNVLEECETTKFSGTTVYLDADIVFMLLGIDELKRKPVYEKLISDLQNLEIKTKVFRHTCEEVAKSIMSSLDWIKNDKYDDSKATKTTSFFVNNGVSVGEIEEMALTLDTKLDHFGIEIDDMDYPEVPKEYMHQEDYYEAIKQYYFEGDPFIDEEELRMTIDNDAKSFLYIQSKNGYNETARISGLKNIFVTCNSSLSKVSKRLLTDKKSIPFCLTDTFMGAMVWKDNPSIFNNQAKQKISNFIYQAFLPSKAMSAKFSQIVDDALSKHEINDEEFALLKRNKNAAEMVVEITEGNIDLVDETLPQEVLKRIKRDSFNEGQQSERIKANKELLERDKCISRKDKQISSLEIDLSNQKIKFAENSIKEAEEKKNKLLKKQQLVEKITNISLFLLSIGFVALLVYGIKSIYDLVFISQDYKIEKVDFMFSVLGIVIPIASLLFVLVFGKTINIKEAIISLRKKALSFILKKSKCSDEEVNQIDFGIKKCQDEIEYQNKQIVANRENL